MISAGTDNLILGRYEIVAGKKGLLGEGSFSVVQKGKCKVIFNDY